MTECCIHQTMMDLLKQLCGKRPQWSQGLLHPSDNDGLIEAQIRAGFQGRYQGYIHQTFLGFLI